MAVPAVAKRTGRWVLVALIDGRQTKNAAMKVAANMLRDAGRDISTVLVYEQLDDEWHLVLTRHR